MEGDARATTHPIQQPVATEGEANNAFDDITYKKGQSFLRMLESFLGEESFRDGIRGYIKAHQYSNSTTADLWNALGAASRKPVTEIATAWTEQPGFPLVTVRRENKGKVLLTQERFEIGFHNASDDIWKIPITYFIDGQSARATMLMSEKTASLEDIPADRALKLNLDGAGNYRVAYDASSWKLLLASLPGMNAPDKVNLLGDAWAFVQAGRQPLAFYTDLVGRLPQDTALAVREQIINVFDTVNHLLADTPQRDQFRNYAQRVLRPTLNELTFQPIQGEQVTVSVLRASLIQELGLLGDQEVIKRCRENFEAYPKNHESVPPDLRAPTFAVVMRSGDAKIWQKLHDLGLKTTSAEEKQNYYDALAFATDPALIKKTLAIALTDELPTSRAVFLVSKVARESDRPDLAWELAKANFKGLLEKVDALGANSYIPSLFTFFTDPNRIEELCSFARAHLAEASARPVEIAADEIRFRDDLRRRLIEQIGALK